MHVIATAGHVDHGKSTLVQRLTGSDPDRLEEEHRRGLSIELGYCWTHWPGVGDCAFVDVPGHERFVPTMLAGVGPVPAVLFVVAADDAWMPQSAEHLVALDALGVRHGVVAVTRSDLADPAPARETVRAQLASTSLAGAPIVTVSGQTGEGLDTLRDELVRMVRRLAVPDPAADIRLWLDRGFAVHGAGTVVTGTLQAGTIRVGDELGTSETAVRVRGVQSLGRDVSAASGVARVALALGGRVPDGLGRGDALVTPQAWLHTDVVDVEVETQELPREAAVHIGAARTGCRVRPLADRFARLRLRHGLPLRPGDRMLVRDPGSSRVWRADVVDPAPPPLRRRGAAARRAKALHPVEGESPLQAQLRRRGTLSTGLARRLGVSLEDADRVAVRGGEWMLDRAAVPDLTRRLELLVDAHRRSRPLDHGLTAGAVADALRLPTADLVPALLPEGLTLSEGRIEPDRPTGLPADVERAVTQLEQEMTGAPFRAPEADRLAELGLDSAAIAAAARTGRLLRLAPTVVLRAGADDAATERLRELPQPFTTSQARRSLDTTRRVAIPLLELLDRTGRTRRLPDDRRETT